MDSNKLIPSLPISFPTIRVVFLAKAKILTGKEPQNTHKGQFSSELSLIFYLVMIIEIVTL
jgi:hypothetical protein